jgi:hypothetical protein
MQGARIDDDDDEISIFESKRKTISDEGDELKPQGRRFGNRDGNSQFKPR